jgi:hypothetical protein
VKINIAIPIKVWHSYLKTNKENDMKTLQDLKNELATFTPNEQLSALTDGAYLSNFDVSESEVEELYSEI